MYLSTDYINAKFRDEVDDPLEGYDSTHVDSESLWKQHEVFGYMSEAVDMLAKKTEGIYKTLEVPFVADQKYIPIPQNVLNIRELSDKDSGRRLRPDNANSQVVGLSESDYGIQHAGRLFGSSGVPHSYVRDYARSALVLVPQPAKDGTLEMQCSVTLSVPLAEGMLFPFFDMEDQRLVLAYMKHLAYAKQDADTLDLQRSQTFLADFVRGADDRASARRNYRRAPATVRMNW